MENPLKKKNIYPINVAIKLFLNKSKPETTTREKKKTPGNISLTLK